MKWTIETRLIFVQEEEADTWDEAKDKVRQSFLDHPVELDPDDCEMHDVTPPSKKEQELLDRFKKIIDFQEAWNYPSCANYSYDVENVTFSYEDMLADDKFKELFGEEEIPRYVYADIHVYDGCGQHTIEKGVEYDVKKLLEYEEKHMKEKKS
jgi:hypothetical protein